MILRGRVKVDGELYRELEVAPQTVLNGVVTVDGIAV